MAAEARVVEVAAAVIVAGGRVLACRRRPDQRHGDKWELPGGKREAGESIAGCLRRELDEELAIEAEIGPELWRTRHTYAGGLAVELFFHLVTRHSGEPENRLFAEIRWVPIGGLSALDFLEADRELVRRIDAGEIEIGRAGAMCGGAAAKR